MRSRFPDRPPARICSIPGVTLQAAVKILRPGLNVLLHTWFIQERSILGGLDHPHIARLIDAGADECGASFLATELVEACLWMSTCADQRDESPRQIAVDLDQYRRHFPVSARPRSSSYVTAKFIRHNRP